VRFLAIIASAVEYDTARWLERIVELGAVGRSSIDTELADTRRHEHRTLEGR